MGTGTSPTRPNDRRRELCVQPYPNPHTLLGWRSERETRSRGMKQRYCASYNTQEEIIFYFNVFYMLIIMMYFVGFYVSVNVQSNVCASRGFEQLSCGVVRSLALCDGQASMCVSRPASRPFEQSVGFEYLPATQPPLRWILADSAARASACMQCFSSSVLWLTHSLTRSLATAHGNLFCWLGAPAPTLCQRRIGSSSSSSGTHFGSAPRFWPARSEILIVSALSYQNKVNIRLKATV